MKKFITIYNLDFLELKPAEFMVIVFMLWHRDNNKANKQYASTSKTAESLPISHRSVFNAISGLAEKGWLERVNGEYYLNTPSMSLMVDVSKSSSVNKDIDRALQNLPKHEDRSKKSYLEQPHIRKAFKEMFPDKQTDRVLDEILKRGGNINNWHSYAIRSIEKSENKRAKKAQKLELKEGY